MSYRIGSASASGRARLIESLVAVLPEAKALEQRFDTFIWSVQRDQRIPEFSRFFAQIIRLNPSVFNGLSNAAKTQILFNKHSELCLRGFSETAVYNSAMGVLQDTIREGTRNATLSEETTHQVNETLKNRMRQLYSGFPEAAISDALGISTGDIEQPPADLFTQIAIDLPVETPFRPLPYSDENPLIQGQTSASLNLRQARHVSK